MFIRDTTRVSAMSVLCFAGSCLSLSEDNEHVCTLSIDGNPWMSFKCSTQQGILLQVRAIQAHQVAPRLHDARH